MSFDSLTINEDGSKNNNLIATYHHREAHFKYTAYDMSSLDINIRQLQTDIHAQHQHEKHALTELNQRFRLFVDRVQLLESQNTKYVAQLADYRQQSLGISSSDDAQLSERYVHLQTDLTTVGYAKVDYELDFELFQLQSGIYQKLIDVAQKWKDERIWKLENELKQSGSVLVTLRTSYAKLEKEIAHLYAACEDTFKQYMRLTHDWCSVKKQRKKWDLSLQILNSHIAFYKNLRSYSVWEFESSSVQSVDVQQFFVLELDKSVKQIRRDFELLYSTFHREMMAYHEVKMEQVQTDVELALQYQQVEIEEQLMSQQTLQVEYEEIQTSLSYEKENFIKFEAMYAKLESELKSIQLQHEERFETQSKDINIKQESIMAVVVDIDEMRRSTINLEAEIIVYHHLLGQSEIQKQVVIAHHAQAVESEMIENIVVEDEITEKFVVESASKRKGSIGIKECASDGSFISFVNHSTSEGIDVSRWVLKRRVDSATELRYTLPEGVRLQQGTELKIYSKLGVGAGESLLNHRAVSSFSHQELVNNDLVSWGMGNKIETYLFNEKGEEEASHSQSIVFVTNNI